MSPLQWLTNVVVPVFTALFVSGFVATMVRIKPERRQINAGARKDEASSADILTGAALKMVEHAQQEAADAHVEILHLRTEATTLRVLVEQANKNADQAVRTSVTCAAEVMRQAETIQQCAAEGLRQAEIIHRYAEELMKNGIPVPQV